MATTLESFTVYVPASVLSELRRAAAAEGRTLSNFASRKLAAAVEAAPLGEAIRRSAQPPRGGRQVDIAEAIADAVKRGPSRPQRRAKSK